MAHATDKARLPHIRHLSSSPPSSRFFCHSQLPTPSQAHQRHHSSNAMMSAPQKAEDEMSLALSDEDMLLCDDEAWSDAGLSSEGARKSGSDDGGKGHSSARSRRLLSLEQSKVLYKILEKTHFPSTQLREAVASQLGVSPRKVQVWFQNRRQVGKKHMIEAVQASLAYSNTSPQSISLEMLSDQLKSMGKGRFSLHEDERTRAWRKHTVRLALNPSAQEEEESKAAIAELENQSRRDYQHYQQHPYQSIGAGEIRLARPHAQQAFSNAPAYEVGETAIGMARSRALSSMSRSIGSLRINVPGPHAASTALHSAKTPTYTGPGSATHLETLSALSRGFAPPMPAVRTSIVPPAIVSSQNEALTLHHHSPQYQAQQQYGGGMGASRNRSHTLAASPVTPNQRWERGGEAMREVRGVLTAEWHQKQRAFETSNRLQGERGDEGITAYNSSNRSIRGVSRSLPQAQSQEMRYRSSTDTSSRLPPPALMRMGSRERFSPYGRPADLPPLSARAAVQPSVGGSYTLLRPSFNPSYTSSGRSRSASSPHYPERTPERGHALSSQHPSERVQGRAHGHVSQLSHSSTSTNASRWNSSNTPTATPTTAASSSVSPGRNSPTSHVVRKPAYPDQNLHHSRSKLHLDQEQTRETGPMDFDREQDDKSRDQGRDRRLSPMDLRSLTTSNIVNTVTASSA